MSTVEREENYTKAKHLVYRLLNIRPRSEFELRQKLQSKNLLKPVIDQALAYFVELDLVNDRQFARQWIISRLKKPFGWNRIRQELELKGISRDIILEIRDEAAGEYDEVKAVTDLAQRRADQYKNIDREKIRQRVYGYLQRRGFNTSTILKAIKSL